MRVIPLALTFFDSRIYKQFVIFKKRLLFLSYYTIQVTAGVHKSGCQVAVLTKVCTVAPSIWASSVWNLQNITLKTPRILR